MNRDQSAPKKGDSAEKEDPFADVLSVDEVIELVGGVASADELLTELAVAEEPLDDVLTADQVEALVGELKSADDLDVMSMAELPNDLLDELMTIEQVIRLGEIRSSDELDDGSI